MRPETLVLGDEPLTNNNLRNVYNLHLISWLILHAVKHTMFSYRMQLPDVHEQDGKLGRRGGW